METRRKKRVKGVEQLGLNTSGARSRPHGGRLQRKSFLFFSFCTKCSSNLTSLFFLLHQRTKEGEKIHRTVVTRVIVKQLILCLELEDKRTCFDTHVCRSRDPTRLGLETDLFVMRETRSVFRSN